MKKLLLSILVLSAAGASAQWTVQNTGFSTPTRGVSEIDPVDANIVWCLAYDGTDTTNNIQEFTRTTDGGENWTAGEIDIMDPTQEFTNISAVDDQSCFVGWVHPTAGLGGVGKTEDGGLSWNNMNPSGYQTPDQSFFNVVYAFNENDIITSGDPIGAGNGEFEVYTSNDGGNSWNLVPVTALPNPILNEWGYNGGNVGVGDSFWFVTSKGNLYRTVDRGVTWTKHSAAGLGDFSATAQGGQIFFSDGSSSAGASTANGILIKRTGPVATATYTLHKTSDGGTTWSAGTAYTQPYRSLAYVPGTSVLVGTGSAAGVSYSAYSPDNGTTWTVIDSGTQRTSVGFVSPTVGWAGGFNEDSTTGGIFKYSGPALATPRISELQKFSATPNPTNGVLQVANETSAISDVVVYDLLGKQVYKGKFSALNQVDLDLSPLNTGSYILKATSESGATQTMKIVKN